MPVGARVCAGSCRAICASATARIGLDGETIEREAAGFHARVVQHECDHLDGILYPQRITDHRLLGFVEELQRHPLDVAALLGADQRA